MMNIGSYEVKCSALRGKLKLASVHEEISREASQLLLEFAVEILETLIPERNGIWWDDVSLLKKVAEDIRQNGVVSDDGRHILRVLAERVLRMKWSTICRYDPRDRANERTWQRTANESFGLLEEARGLAEAIKLGEIYLLLQPAVGAAIAAHIPVE